MSALIDARRLADLVAQLDQGEAMRDMIVSRISEHLARNGQKFVDLANAIADSGSTGDADEGDAERGDQRPKPVPKGPYIHQPMVRKRFGRWPTRVRGKTVVRKTRPPIGIAGRLRVIKHDQIGGIHKATCSLETEHEIYEPFDLHFRDDDEMRGIVVECSTNGTTLRF